MNINNMSVATKLWLAVTVIILSLVLLIGFAAVRTSRLQAETAVTLGALSERVKAASTWAGLAEANAVRTRAVITTFDPSIESAFTDAMVATNKKIDEVQKKIEAMTLSPQAQAQMQKIGANKKAMQEIQEKANALKSSGSSEEAQTVISSQYNPAVEAYLGALRELVQMEEQATVSYSQEMGEARVATVRIAGIAIVFILAGILVGASVLIRSIRRPLDQANHLAARIAQGDLSARIDTSRGDEFGELMKSLARMNESLARMVHQVRQSTDSISTASAEIATGNHDLSVRTEQTSSNLQSTASAMDELTTTVQHSADNARQASQLAASASSVAQKGGEVVQQVVSTMDEINTSSKKISDIIGVIDGIAFQTNILALNAAVEAARAGEQGRGFAVVAGEVRSLAGRSAEAAKEIKGLINTSVQKVESGTELVTNAGATMGEIVQSVRRVADVIGEITAASAEQSAGISQVNSAIANLDQMTQQNAALVEQSAAAAQSMREQAEQLAQAVAVFKVSGMAAMPQRPAMDVTPRPEPAKSLAKPAAALPSAPAVEKPVSKPVEKPAPAVKTAAAESDEWETF